MGETDPQVTESEWMSFPGGELEGRPPRALCPACREALAAGTLARGRRQAGHPAGGARGPLCFQCYRAELDRERRLRAVGALDTASEERIQGVLPFEPVNRARLERLRHDRALARDAERNGPGRYAERRRQAQMAARRALQRIAAGVAGRPLLPAEHERRLAAATRAAELQLPEAWLPFVVGR
jgi:hypothetical protein